MVMGIHNRLLVVTVTGVTAHKLHQLILVIAPVLVPLNHNLRRGRKGNLAAVLRYYTGSGVNGGLIGHTGIYYSGLCRQKRNCLTLHVGSHEGTVCVVVL